MQLRVRALERGDRDRMRGAGFKLIQRDKFMKRGYRDSRSTLCESTLPGFMRFAVNRPRRLMNPHNELACAVS